MVSTRSRMSGSVLSSSVVEAPKWRTDRAERRAGKAGCLSKGLSVRDGSHLDVPKGFDQNGPLLRREVSKYRHISSPSLLALRSEEHTSELQSLMRISYAVFCLKKKTQQKLHHPYIHKPHLSDKYTYLHH